ncbi:hypothetical protein EHQ27_04610 [Leptospira wolffii]|uniref:Uncharacterized protein n=1 Tax=Leptospira wolffii TaxID=409998 RepID=A0A2M9Z948_9LEPT|nr:hypothetical protein [Leptospira wolffii]EPG65695.1 hypothetical protein LEP1GSC061_1122 [Leptospira wolffii serovar Khorat str. Khorat-H2]PJZ64949.1 hypothetical protein CH371_15725 [Leptospira wolffii]TGK58144.1 hypothetical protein EHQ32_12660 [Leptospira wolffii]TGK68823.1 hypothetical protein EHQ35_18530 [Leptospira wolffii]TGK76337.1 hypothetical protein EHQ27_04610 [Leptospira wolffii]
MKKFVVLIISFIISLPIYAENFYSLYGFRIDQSMKTAEKELGEVAKEHVFEDGYKAFFFRKKGHIVVLETEPSQPERIWSIQVEGENVPSDRGLNGVIPGDPKSKVISTFGTPEQEKKAVNSMDQKESPNTSILTYYQNGNFSFEIKDGKVSSIKLVLRLEKSPKETPDPWDFISALKSKNESLQIRLLAGDPVFNATGTELYPQESMLTFLRRKDIRDFLYLPGGVSELTEADLFNSNMRFFDKGGFGWVIRYARNRKVFEFVYVKPYDEWLLWEINTFSDETNSP